MDSPTQRQRSLSMGWKQTISIFMAALAAILAVCEATEHIVGDELGWSVGFNYTIWVSGKKFYAGDTLVFNYLRNDHNVYTVDEAGYKNCMVLPGVKPLASGNDVINLTTPGNKWFICGMPSHCSEADQKLGITVLQRPSSLAAPPPPSLQFSPAETVAVPGYHVVLVVAMVIVGIC